MEVTVQTFQMNLNLIKNEYHEFKDSQHFQLMRRNSKHTGHLKGLLHYLMQMIVWMVYNIEAHFINH